MGVTEQSALLCVFNDESDRAKAGQLAQLLGYAFSHVIMGTGYDAANYLKANALSPAYIVFDAADRRTSAASELEALAEQCVQGTKVTVVGDINDIVFYREMLDIGAIDYFTKPIDIQRIARTFAGKSAGAEDVNTKRIISFASAGAGDGASTIAMNTAYALSTEHKSKTVIVDMDYQYGMIAKNLDLSAPYGIKELLDHPDRGIDATLIDRMVLHYSERLHVIAAPNNLHFYPSYRPEIIRDLLAALQQRYDYIILDMPNVWAPWVSAALNQSDDIVLIAQLWLKSVTHASRQLQAWRLAGINVDKVRVHINRSGAKFKEGITAKDFERVCGKPIGLHLSNDTKTTVEAEQKGTTILELKRTALADEIIKLAGALVAAR
jgi:pilus assembly protein CpaE